ncbi:MAG: hypothetical protein PHP01_04935 [Phycisphaerae bacterium]|nr:hypothetical protein [Phycisphaerae bacterium]
MLYRLLLLAALCIVFAGCKKSSFPSQSTTGATAYAPQSSSSAKPILPAQSDYYQIIEKTDGVKSFVVKYDNNFYRGGEIVSEEGFQKLQKLGIKTIVSITPTDFEKDTAKKYGIAVRELAFEPTAFDSNDIEQYLGIIKRNEGPFYVHCHSGLHRAGAFGLIYRLAINQWEFDRALIEFGNLGGSLLDDQRMISAVKQWHEKQKADE